MEYNRFWELLAKVNAGEASPQEQLEFNQALAESAEYQNLSREMNVFWKMEVPAAGEVGKEETSLKWEKVRRQISIASAGEGNPELRNKRSLIRRISGWSAAAVLIGLTSYAGWWFGHEFPSPGKMNIISTRYGSKSKIELPDGTQVWLNGGSKLVYKEDYDINNREIQLEGEAFFDVVRNAARPFVIHTHDMDVKVLGTSFNIMAYPNDKTSEASLIKGSIEISFPGRPADRLILKPDEKITILHNSTGDPVKVLGDSAGTHRRQARPLLSLSRVTYQPADSVILETAWTKNMLIFRSKSFDEIAREMERWFNTTIHCTDTSILNRKFTGSFYHESVTEALDALKFSYPFQYNFDKENNVITITSK